MASDRIDDRLGFGQVALNIAPASARDKFRSSYCVLHETDRCQKIIIETYQQLRGGFLQEHMRSEVAKDPLCFTFK